MSSLKVLGLAFLLVVALAIYEANKDAIATARGGLSQSLAEAVLSAEPPDERAFVATVDRFASAYRAAQSDMAKGSQRPARSAALCADFGGAIRNWAGTLTTLSSNNEGKGVVEIAIAPGITIGTWNNSLSDIGDDTLIHPGTAVYERAVRLREGAAVRFSGSLLKGDPDCFREKNITQAGSMTQPAWLIRFSEIGGL